ncbi:MAG: GntR family transcriptional regulator [Pseudomonadota bacterium]
MASRPGGKGKSPHPSLGEEIYGRVKRDILSCILLPGERCSEGQLAEQYGVGKAPIRWALAALSRECLVIARPRQGYTVAPLTIESVNEVFDVRLIIEPAAARMAAGRADTRLLKDIQARIAARWKAGDRRSERRWIEANIAFHVEITRAAGNERLTRIASALLDESQRTMHLLTFVFDGVRPMGRDHEDLIDALGRGDGETAERVARRHLEYSRKLMMDTLLGNAAIRPAAIGHRKAAALDVVRR